MNAKIKPDGDKPEELVPTLGSLLYGKCQPRTSEEEWAALVRATAAGDTSAFGSLYMSTHGIVFASMVRILRSRQKAEDVTVEVFHDVWRSASTYDPGRETVVAWIMNLARLRAAGCEGGGGQP